MNIEPAHINQIRQAQDGRLYDIDADVGHVADDLRKIDAGLKVRFSEHGRAFIVYHEHHEGCPHNGTGGPGSTYLVKTVNAHQNALGTWEGLDQRVVRRILEIGHSTYDYAAELEAHNRQVAEEKRKRVREQREPLGEKLAHAIRKDLGLRPNGRVVVPRDI